MLTVSLKHLGNYMLRAIVKQKQIPRYLNFDITRHSRKLAVRTVIDTPKRTAASVRKTIKPTHALSQ